MTISSVLNFIFSRKSSTPCAICIAPITFRGDELARYFFQCTLGQALSYHACDECRAKRCATPYALTRLIILARTNFSCLPGNDEWEMDEDQSKTLQQQFSCLDVEGLRSQSPVHLWNSGRYYTVDEAFKEAWFDSFLDHARERYRDWCIENEKGIAETK
jgi:hypothetical protein